MAKELENFICVFAEKHEKGFDTMLLMVRELAFFFFFHSSEPLNQPKTHYWVSPPLFFKKITTNLKNLNLKI